MSKHFNPRLFLGVATIFASSTLMASALNIDKTPFYVAAKVGIMTGSFNSSYLDQTDLIPQNMAQSIQQHGYTEGLAIGYSRVLLQQYLLGVELAGNYDSHSANFQAGAATAAFSDTVRIRNHFDLTVVPGILLNASTAAYLKLGITRANLQDTLVSPAGFNPVVTRYGSSTGVNGFVAGLGLEKSVWNNVAVFVEGNYRDYGTVNFNNFQNFTATYTNSAHVYSYDVGLGVGYHF